MFLRELPKRIIPVRRHVEIIALQHQSPLVPCLGLIPGPFVPVIIGQICRQTFDPIALLYAVEDSIADPGMHDLVAQGIGLHIMPLDDSAPQQGK